MANLINFGIVPMTLENADDYENFAEGDEIAIEGFAAAVAGENSATLVNKTNGKTAKASAAASQQVCS